MNNIDFTIYKDNLKQYLSAKGFNIKNNPMFCFNPSHINTETEACLIYDNNFKCQSCGAEGDIYDACELLTGITDKVEQFKEVERVIKGFNPEDIKKTNSAKKVEFKADPKCIKAFEKYVGSHTLRKDKTIEFLKQRGYNKDTIEKMYSKFGYWGGFNDCTISKQDLYKAGIPGKAWNHEGVVIRLGYGYKLMYYDTDGKCQKVNSLKAATFPAPKKELSGHIYLTEAELSAFSMIANGYDNTFSTGGVNGIKSGNVDLLKKCESIAFLFDGDNAGRYHSGLDEFFISKDGKEAKPKSVINKIWESGYKGKIFACRLPDGKDPDDLIREENFKSLEKCISEKVEITKPAKEEVKQEKKIEQQPIGHKPFHFLGYDTKAYYVLPKSQQVPLKINRGETSIKNWLFELASPEWWESRFNKEIYDKQGEPKNIFDHTSAINWFREESYRAGMYDTRRIKGVGCYKDGDKIILNTGKDLKVSGNGAIEYSDFTGDNFYTRSKRFLKISDSEWSSTEGLKLWDAVSTFGFEKRMDKIAIAGYMALAPFASILFRRPNIWLTAQKGIGKSHLLEELIIPAVGGEEYVLFTEGLSSEAYIRQSTTVDNVPIGIDEFEPKDEKSKATVKAILKLVTSSYGGKKLGKGSSGHEAIDFELSSMFCFGSVNTKIDNAAELSRIHVCRMKKSTGICTPPEDFGGLRRRIFTRLPKILEEIDICKRMLLESGLENRIADTYSPFFVGTWNIISDLEFLDSNMNVKYLDYFGNALDELINQENQEDEDKVIERIIKERIRISSDTERTIAEMLIERENDLPTSGLLYDGTLQRYGIRVSSFNNKDVLAISLKSNDISRILADTPFSDYAEIIQRHTLVVDKSNPRKMAGQNTRCVLLDWDGFQKMYLDVDKGV